MKEITGNLWDGEYNFATWRCITTNGFRKKNGDGVMGAGVAKEANARYPGLARDLGDHILYYGNVLYPMLEHRLIMFPVKYNWWEAASLELIQASTVALLDWLDDRREVNTTVILPWPGCGNGGLTKDVVRPIIEVLPDNVFVIDKS